MLLAPTGFKIFHEPVPQFSSCSGILMDEQCGELRSKPTIGRHFYPPTLNAKLYLAEN